MINGTPVEGLISMRYLKTEKESTHHEMPFYMGLS